MMHPHRYTLAEEIAPGVMYHVNEIPFQQSTIFMALRYLTLEEQNAGEAEAEWEVKTGFTLGRVALKDAVRKAVWPGDAMPYPVEIGTRYDDNGKIYAIDRSGGPIRPGLEVSVAHKADRAVAIVADRPVGIDLEHVEPREQSFLDLAFSPAEQTLMAEQGDVPEWSTRFWVAKEAYGKMTGEGLRGNPRRYTVTAVDGELITVEGVVVTTRRLDHEYITGWTT
jgi:phosphopantetheinyl transferase (holo-ACP synthase)